MKRILILLFAVMFCSTAAFAQYVRSEEATEYAACVFGIWGMTPAHAVTVECRNGDTLYYVFKGDGATALISADRRVQPLLAFFDSHPVADESMAPAAQMWLNHYADQLAALRAVPYTPEDEHPAWNRLRNGNLRPEAAVAPFLRSNWGQGSQYNYYCPKDRAGDGGRVVTGCVATAMSQLMYHFRFPETGTGSYSYTDQNYGLQSADYENTTYDYGAMCDNPTNVNTAISTLMYHCGVGVDMVYGPDGSGMYNHSAADVLKNHFKFSPDTHYEFRDSTSLDWDSLIVSHLERGIPLYYAGWSVPDINGHAFICDGYRMVDSSYFYHFNFGWDGSSNGYFYTNALNVSGSHFNLAQELIVNAYPDTVQYEYPVSQPQTGSALLTTRDGSFLVRDGYPAGMDYTWVIRPETENLNAIRLKFSASIGEGDTLFITTDNPSDEPMAVTGDTARNLSFSCSEIMVRFISASEGVGHYVSVSYASSINAFCSGTPLTTATSGTITDGSGENDYNPLTYCGFKIRVTGNPAVKLTFHEFDLEDGHDSLHIYSYQNQTSTYITSLTGFLEPGTEMQFATNRLLFVFESDEQNNAAGFTFDYEGIPSVSIAEQEPFSVSVHPNPVSSVMYVTVDGLQREGNLQLQLCDVFGRELSVTPISGVGTQTEVDLSGIAKGIYLLRIVCSDGGVVTKKIVRQ